MLAPVTEADAGERALLALGLGSARRWPAFADELPRRPASTSATAAAARSWSRATATRPRRWTASSRCATAWGWRPSGCCRRRRGEREPALAPTVRLALDVPDDHAVDPRLLVAALAARPSAPARSCAQAPRSRACARRWPGPGRGARGRRARRWRRQVVVAAGPWSGQPRAARRRARARAPGQGPDAAPARPGGPACWARGALRRRLPRPARRRALRARRDGRGARVRHGDDRGACTTCCATPPSSSPACSSWRSRSCRGPAARHAGQRAGARREPALEGLLWATGHHRNGILLAPVTADLVAAGLAGEALEHPFGARRFAARGGGAVIRLNGSPAEGRDGATVADLLSTSAPRSPPRRGGGRRRRGRAARRVGPAPVPEGARVEALTAMQGG